jgi:hypothetical protein
MYYPYSVDLNFEISEGSLTMDDNMDVFHGDVFIFGRDNTIDGEIDFNFANAVTTPDMGLLSISVYSPDIYYNYYTDLMTTADLNTYELSDSLNYTPNSATVSGFLFIDLVQDIPRKRTDTYMMIGEELGFDGLNYQIVSPEIIYNENKDIVYIDVNNNYINATWLNDVNATLLYYQAQVRGQLTINSENNILIINNGFSEYPNTSFVTGPGSQLYDYNGVPVTKKQVWFF